MPLIEIPSEVLITIFEYLVYDTGIRPSTRLRIVCRTFDCHISDAIYSLPTFDGLHDTYPAHLTWDIGMSKPTIEALIHTKLKRRLEVRPLVQEIIQTVHFIESTPEFTKTTDYANALVHLAANHLPLHAVVERLSKRTSSAYVGSGVVENALAAALYLDRPSDVRNLLDLGAKAHFRTKSFGDPLVLAACHSRPTTFLLVLRNALATSNKYRKHLVISRYVLALQQVAACGRADLFCKDLFDSMDEMSSHYPAHALFEPAIRSATLASHGNFVLAMLEMLRNRDAKVLTISSKPWWIGVSFWIGILRLAASKNLGEVVLFVFNHTGILDCHKSLNLPVEDASRCGHTEMLALLIAHGSEYNLTSYAGAVYWAARGAYYGALSSILAVAGSSGLTLVGDALCGASAHGVTGIPAVLQKAADADLLPLKDLDKFSTGKFPQVIDDISNATTTSRPVVCPPHVRTAERSARGWLKTFEDGLFSDPVPEKEHQLAKACSEGDILAVQRILTECAGQHETLSAVFASCFTKPILHNQPGILQYLFEKTLHSRYFSPEAIRKTQSTAILQVLLDNGWDINKVSDKEKPPALRCDDDVTPLSYAVDSSSFASISLMLQGKGDLRKGQLLHYAMKRGWPDQLAIIDMLVAFGASIDARMFEDDPKSWLKNQFYGMCTPLQKAAELGNVDVVEYLLECGADRRLLRTVGDSALDLAEDMGELEIVTLLEQRYSLSERKMLESSSIYVRCACHTMITCPILGTEHW